MSTVSSRLIMAPPDSLARKVFFEEQGLGVGDPLPSDPSTTVGEALLATHRSYAPSFEGLLGQADLIDLVINVSVDTHIPILRNSVVPVEFRVSIVRETDLLWALSEYCLQHV